MASDVILKGMRRHLGEASSISVSALGAGCWAIGGPWQFDGRPAGWGQVDDDESIAAIHKALDLGITLFHTADVNEVRAAVRRGNAHGRRHGREPGVHTPCV